MADNRGSYEPQKLAPEPSGANIKRQAARKWEPAFLSINSREIGSGLGTRASRFCWRTLPAALAAIELSPAFQRRETHEPRPQSRQRRLKLRIWFNRR
jgi:hypothetical protein